MPTVKNLSYGPITVQLVEEKSLTLGPRESKKIDRADADSPDIMKSLKEGSLFIIPDEEAAAPPTDEASPTAESLAAKKDKPPKANQ